MAGRVDDEQAGEANVKRLLVAQGLRLRQQSFAGKLRGSDLLRDASCLALLNVGVSNLVKQLCLACVDVAHDAGNGRAQVLRSASRPGEGIALVSAFAAVVLAHGRLPLFPLHFLPLLLLLKAPKPLLLVALGSLNAQLLEPVQLRLVVEL